MGEEKGRRESKGEVKRGSVQALEMTSLGRKFLSKKEFSLKDENQRRRVNTEPRGDYDY